MWRKSVKYACRVGVREQAIHAPLRGLGRRFLCCFLVVALFAQAPALALTALPSSSAPGAVSAVPARLGVRNAGLENAHLGIAAFLVRFALLRCAGEAWNHALSRACVYGGPPWFVVHRYYDPSLGRYLTTDPLGSSANPYDYALANPLRYTDTQGLCVARSFVDPFKNIFDFLKGGYALATQGVPEGMEFRLGAGYDPSSPSLVPGLAYNSWVSYGLYDPATDKLYENKLESNDVASAAMSVLGALGGGAGAAGGVGRSNAGWLARMDARSGGVGHTVAQHVGLTDSQLGGRIAAGLNEASTFSSLPTAEQAISDALRGNRGEILGWLRSPTAGPALRLYGGEANGPVLGRILTRGQSVVETGSRVVVDLRLNPSGSGWFVWRAFVAR